MALDCPEAQEIPAPLAILDGFVELQCAITQKTLDGFMVPKAVALMATTKLVALSNPRALERRARATPSVLRLAELH